jgi:fibrillarin-like pre-rRNA processing protein
MKEKNFVFPGVFKIKGKLYTENLSPGFKVYGERLIHKKRGKEFREWDPFRSKLAAAILNGLKKFPFFPDCNVLYLGASAGTTPSHISDIIGKNEGLIYCVEISERMMFDLMRICEKRKNMIPILGDANKPQNYSPLISSPIDVIYQDVAQKNQAEIILKNFKFFKPKHAMLAIKSRSISSVKKPKDIFKEEIKKLEEQFNILEMINLKPYDKDHILVNLKRKDLKREEKKHTSPSQ